MLVRVANMARLWRGVVWRVSDALAPVKKKSVAGHDHASSKQQAFGQSGSQTFDCSMGLLGFLDSWGLVLLTFDADDADEAWAALCQAEPESLTLRSLVEVVVSVVGS